MSVKAVRMHASRVPVWARLGGAILALSLVLVAFNATRETALAVTFSVNSTVDAVDSNPGDGTCATAAGECTLRAAIQEANASGPLDDIAIPAGTYKLTIAGAGEDAAATGDLDITADLDILGAGAGATIVDASNLDRAFEVRGGAVTSFSGLSVLNGLVTGDGGAILGTSGAIAVDHSSFTNNHATGGGGQGGAIAGLGGQVTVFQSTFTNNSATFGGGAVSSVFNLDVTGSTFELNEGGLGGGALYPNGPSTSINDSTFVSNSADSGGAVHSNSSSVNIVNSTFYRNSAVNGGGVDTRTGTMTITNATFFDNAVTGLGDSIQNQDAQGGVTTVGNTIMSGRTSNNCSGTVGDGGNNINWPSLANCPGTNADPLLGPFANNGGPTQTFALSAGSPAIDTGNNAACAPADQRGGRRPVDGNSDGSAICDIGAYELGFVVDSAGLDASDGDPGTGACDTGTGECTLRAAIEEANLIPGMDYITFDIPVSGVATIALASALPALTDPVFIDGSSQPGAVCSADTFAGRNILIAIAGNAGLASGLQVAADGSTIRGLSMGGFTGPLVPAIQVTADEVAIECNHLGVAANGSTPAANTAGLVFGSAGTTGGRIRGNVLSGNTGTGLRVQSHSNVSVTNNRIGMAADGATAVPNNIFGVRILGATNTIIGGSNGVTPGGACTGDCNVISGNDPSDGVYIDSDTTNTTIQNNHIGTDVTGTLDRGNSADGITVEDGGTVVIEGNLISGNNNDGIHHTATDPLSFPAITVRGNRIGTNAAGTAALGNSTHGIHITGARGITIGGPLPTDRNVISGNGQAGINVCGVNCGTAPVTLDLTVEGNYIGTTADGSALLSNGATFAHVAFDDTEAVVVRGNVVASNSGVVGIWFQDSLTPTVQGNYVGLNAAGTGTLGVSGNGIMIDTTDNGLVTGNTVAGATGDGIQLFDGADGNTVVANGIGVNAGQNAALGNGVNGIRISAISTGNMVDGNLIAASGGAGILVDGSDGNILRGNAIGFVPGSSPQPAPNTNGIHLQNACDTTIGEAGPGQGNTIGFSAAWGVRIEASTCAALATNALVQNRIGTVLPSLADIGNAQGGVLVESSTGVLVGFDGQPGNVITNNGGPGVRVEGGGATSVAEIRGNQIYSNDGFLGIDLVAVGDVFGDFRTPNDSTDNDTGPNALQNTPVITNVTATGGLTISGTLPGGTGVTTYHFYATDQLMPGASCSPLNPGSSVGQRFLGSTGSNGDTFNILLAAATLGPNEYVTATATAGTGTSEFSACFLPGAGGGGLTASIFAGASSVEAGVSQVRIDQIPLSALSTLPAAVQGVPISAIDLSASPISAIPISAIPISAITVSGVPISAIPISAIPISAIPISAISTWEGVIEGSALEGVPLQTITLQQVLDDPVAGPRILNAPISAIRIFDTSLRNVSISSVLLGAAPISAIAQNGWSCGSASLCASPISAIEAELKGTPISAIPISAIPISAIDLAGTPISAIGINASPISAINLNSIPISAIPISAIPISAIPISAIPISAIPISAIGVNGAPISAIPISAITTPTGQSFCDYAASLTEPCGSAATIGEFVAIHGAGSDTLAAVPISAIPISAIELLSGYTDSLGWFIGFETVGRLYDANGSLGTMTLGQLIVLVLEAQNYPWEELPLDQVNLQAALGTGPVLTYTVEHTLAAGPAYTATVNVSLPRGFVYRAGSADVDGTGIGDPIVAGTELTFTVPSLASGTSHDISFDAYSSLSTGNGFALATVSAAGEQVTSVSGMVVVTEAFEPANNTPTGGPIVASDTLYLSHIGSVDDVDFYQVPSQAAGARIAVYLSQLGVDMDLVMYTADQAPINSTSLSNTATAPQTLPVGDQGAGAVREGQFLEPQTLQDIAIESLPIKATSALRGTVDETIESIALRDNEGPYYIGVRSYNRAVTEAPYVLRVRVTQPGVLQACPAPAFAFPGDAPAPLAGYTGADANTAIVVNMARMAKLYGDVATNELITRLNAFATSAPGVKAKIVDVSGVNYGAYDSNRCDPAAANAVVAQVAAQTLAAVGGPNSAVKHLVIVGDDDVIPMARISDVTRISNERDYGPDLAGLEGGAFGAVATGHYLSDDPYGDFDPIPWLERFLYVPDVGIGRLVESPAEIGFALDAYVASGGSLNPESAYSGVNPGPDSYAVSGYDFLADGSDAVEAALAGQGWTSGSFFTLISDLWNADNLLGLLAEGASVNSINAHFDHHRLLPADQDAAGLSNELVTTEDLDTLTAGLTGKLIFSMGCHSGLNVSDLLSQVGDARTQDWAQTFVGRGAVLIGNTGYGYGDTESVALSERLMTLFAKRMDGSITAAQALTFAKQDYYATLGLYGVYDEKALMQATYYGLPMYRVHAADLPPDQVPPIVPPAGLPVPPSADGDIPGTSSATVTVNPAFGAPDTGPLGTFYPADTSTYDQGTATVTIGEVGTQVTQYQPIQPRLSFDVTDPGGLVAHGALITALSTQGGDQGIDPVYARPIIDSGEEAEISSGDAVFPARLQAISSYNAPDGARQNLVLVTGQFLPDGDPATASGAQRLFDQIGARVYYSASDDFFAPDILRAEGLVNGGNATFTVETRDRDATGVPGGSVALVTVLYRDANCGAACNDFTALTLTPAGAGVWTATVPTSALKLEFLVQAVDTAGNVGVSTSKGVLYLTETLPPPAVILSAPPVASSSPIALFSFDTESPTAVPVTFECRLDTADFASCEDPKLFEGLASGQHDFRVRAANGAGSGPEARHVWTIATGNSDGDNLPDIVDACRSQPEDLDGLLDSDGCPEIDADGDGTPDTTDGCPLAAGPANRQGCANACSFTPTISGTNGDDVIQGTTGNDIIFARNGNDVVFGNGGHDVICAGDGNDVITTGNGNDNIDGGAGNDVIVAGDGYNAVFAGAGNDQVTGGAGNDVVNGGDGDDTVAAGDGNNQVSAAAGNDVVTTGAGNDTIDTANGNDTVQAGAGDDTISAGGGNDSVDGGPGIDICQPGGGNNDVINCEG